MYVTLTNKAEFLHKLSSQVWTVNKVLQIETDSECSTPAICLTEDNWQYH